MSYMAAAVGETYSDAYICSIHGVKLSNITSRISLHAKTFMLMSGVKDVNMLGHLLSSDERYGLQKCSVTVGYQISYPDETISQLSPQECTKLKREGLYICMIKNPNLVAKNVTPQLSDAAFIREKVPMTKEEIRHVSICKLHLKSDSVFYDVGSGTGSIAVEAASLSDDMEVYAIEQKENAVQLIMQNKEKHGLENIHVINAKAPDGMDNLPVPTHAFIGGSGGNLKEIIEILCPDSYHAMMVMGANYRSQYHPKMVGVTGSVGKTTTKQMTYAALSSFGETIKTEGNQNNELGMPRTLMRLESSTEYAVIEMGMSHAGEIDRLVRAARPDVGIITCIGVSHIGNLGSQENICKAKLEICNGLPEGAPLVLNYDDPFLRKAVLPAHVRPVWFSLSDENADVCALSIRQETDGMSFVLEDQEHGTFVVNIPAMGRHNVANALAAYCAATRLGCDAKRVIRGLSNFEQTGRRQKVVDSEGVTVIEDCYNANPDSMKAALAMFKDFPCKRRFALLGDMLELGELSREAHEELGRLAAESGLYCLITYGEQAKRTAVVAAAKGVETLHAENYREAADALLDRVQPGDAVLVKASHGMALEKVLDIFYEEHKEAEV